VLERDAAARELAVLRAIDRALAVERDGELRALGDDLVYRGMVMAELDPVKPD
jgi:hypothetical protein